MSGDRVFNENRLGKYFWQTANIVDDLDLSVYAFRLYCHLCRTSSLHDVDVSVRAMSKACKMSVGAICNAKDELKEAGLISIREMDGPRGRPYHEITILDIVARNIEHCQRQSSRDELISSPHELNSSPRELISSRGGTPYKNQSKTKKKPAITPAPEPQPEEPVVDVTIALQVRKELTSAGVQHGERLDEVVKRLGTRPDGALIARLIAQGTALRAEREMLCGRPLANPAGLVIKTCLSYPLDEPLQTEAGVEAALETERRALERAKTAKQRSGKSFRREQVPDSTDAEREAANEKAGKELQVNMAKHLEAAQARLRTAQERLDKEQNGDKRKYWQDMITHVNAEIEQMHREVAHEIR